MTSTSRTWRLAALTAVALIGPLAAPATAQEFPQREITLVVPFAPGGSTDFVARTVAAFVERELGQPVVVSNMPGANTIIGTEFVANSAPDGHTLVVATNGHTTNTSMYRSLPYDAETDFTPVVLLGATPNVIAINPQVTVETLEELIEYAAGLGRPLPFATAGHGTIQHFTGELLGIIAGIEVEHIAYPGGGPAATDVRAGHVPLLVSGLPPAMAHLEGGHLTALAVTSRDRSPALQDIATAYELGMTDLVSSFYLAILGPAGLPDDVVETLNAAFNSALQDPDTATRLTDGGVIIEGGSPQDLAAFMAADTELWARVIAESGIEMIE
jgi:tripartite-type tricarboxylate transporter receptor subunit TctC